MAALSFVSLFLPAACLLSFYISVFSTFWVAMSVASDNLLKSLLFTEGTFSVEHGGVNSIACPCHEFNSMPMSSWAGKPQTLINESNKVEIMSCLVMLTLL